MDDIKYKWGDGLKNASALDIYPNIELPQLKYKDSRLIEREFRLSTGKNPPKKIPTRMDNLK